MFMNMSSGKCAHYARRRGLFSYLKGSLCLRVHQVPHDVPTAVLHALEVRGYNLKRYLPILAENGPTPSGWIFAKGWWPPILRVSVVIRTLQNRIWGRSVKSVRGRLWVAAYRLASAAFRSVTRLLSTSKIGN